MITTRLVRARSLSSKHVTLIVSTDYELNYIGMSESFVRLKNTEIWTKFGSTASLAHESGRPSRYLCVWLLASDITTSSRRRVSLLSGLVHVWRRTVRRFSGATATDGQGLPPGSSSRSLSCEQTWCPEGFPVARVGVWRKIYGGPADSPNKAMASKSVMQIQAIHAKA